MKPGDFGADPAGAIAGSVSAPAATFDPFEDARAMAQFLPLKTEVDPLPGVAKLMQIKPCP